MTDMKNFFQYLCSASQAEVIAADHAEALMMDTARGMLTVTVTASGLRITQAMLDEEVRSTRAPRTMVYSGPMPLVIGLNASSNMLAG